MDRLWLDIRYSLRLIRQRPLFALVACLSIAIGVGATTVIVSVMNAVLFEPPAGIDDPARVVEVGRTRGGRGFDTFSFPELLDLQSKARTLEAVAGWRIGPLSFSTGEESERIMGMAASAEYFDVFGLEPARGRFYTKEEDRVPGTNPVVVLSDRFWRNRLAAKPGIVGRTIDLNRRLFTVVGIAQAEFRGHIPALAPDVYYPLTMFGITRPGFGSWDVRWASWLVAIGRLAPGASIEQGNAELAALFKSFKQPNDDPRNDRSATLMGLGMVPGGGRTPVTAFLTVLLTMVVFVLLITCANVAGMLIARSAAREKEMAIRLAIGSGRAGLVRQLLIESTTLFLIGGTVGVLLAKWGAAALSAVRLPTPIPVELDFRADPRVLVVGLAVALVTGLVFGLAPALQASNPALLGALKSEYHQKGSRGGKLRRLFVTAQVALSLVLLASSGLFLRSLQRAAQIEDGFDATGVHMVSFDLSMDGYEEERGRQFQQQLLDRVARIPGVTAVGYADELPLDLGVSEQPVRPEGWSPGNSEQAEDMESAFARVGGEYFTALQVPLLHGRVFGQEDTRSSTPVLVVSREFARQAWPNEDAVGKRVRISGGPAGGATVIGVVADVKNKSLMEEPEAMYYQPVTQDYQASLTLLVRGNGSVKPADLNAAIRDVDPQLSTSLTQRLDQYTALGVLPQRLAASIASALGLLALLLSALGVYGVIAFMVAQRTRELGTRVALGADPAHLVRLVLRDGFSLAGPGVVIGVLGALGVGRLVRSFILGVPSADPFTFTVVPVVMLAAIALACFNPARRAARTQPILALKAE